MKRYKLAQVKYAIEARQELRNAFYRALTICCGPEYDPVIDALMHKVLDRFSSHVEKLKRKI